MTQHRFTLAIGAAIGCIIGSLCTIGVQSVSGAIVIPEGLGDLIGGAGTMFGAVFVVLGFVRWETQKRREREAEAAARALVASADVCMQLQHVAWIDGVVSPYPLEAETFKAWHAWVTEPIMRKKFDDARIETEAYLSKEAVAALHALALLVDKYAVHMQLALMHLDDNHVFIRAFMKDLQGPDAEQHIRTTLQKIHDNLRPYAFLPKR